MHEEGEEGSLETSTGIRIEARRGHAAVEKIEEDYKIGEVGTRAFVTLLRQPMNA